MQLALLRTISPILLLMLILYSVKTWIDNKDKQIKDLSLAVELLEIENKALKNFRKGICNNEEIKKDINSSSNDSNGTKYNWVFLKGE